MPDRKWTIEGTNDTRVSPWALVDPTGRTVLYGELLDCYAVAEHMNATDPGVWIEDAHRRWLAEGGPKVVGA